MEIIAIKTPTSPVERRIIERMHRLRARIFKGRLAWNVRCVADMEFDQFDNLGPAYIIALSRQAEVLGCARLLPTTGQTMLQEVFPELLANGTLPAHEGMVESSRFCVDTAQNEEREGPLHLATRAMFSGIVEWSLLNGFSEIATATDLRFERILRRAGWPLRRLGQPRMINETHSIAGILPADHDSFDLLRPSNYRSRLHDFKHQAA